MLDLLYDLINLSDEVCDTSSMYVSSELSDGTVFLAKASGGLMSLGGGGERLQYSSGLPGSLSGVLGAVVKSTSAGMCMTPCIWYSVFGQK